MKLLLLLLFTLYFSYTYAFYTCQPPQVDEVCFPKQYIYNHGESVSCAYPHKYFLRCFDGIWI